METITTITKRKLALILPAHNEEVVLGDTIISALKAGISERDVYVVSDGSKDRTVEIALEHLPASNVLDQPQSGKALAVQNALSHFDIAANYQWVHIADADGVFELSYFSELNDRLNDEWVAATGHLQSLKGGWISKYRVYEYTWALEVVRRIQAKLDTIPVIPGVTCMFRTDILEKLDFTHPSLTEDMDLTLQIHRQKLGRIGYIPQAKALTQDPKDLRDYYNQIMRWYRGNWQVMSRHKIGRRAQRIDGYLGFVIVQEFVLVLQLTILPFACWWGQNYRPLAAMFLADIAIMFAISMWAAKLNKRPDVMGAFPMFYFLRFVNLYAFFKAWFEIVVQHRFSTATPGWSTAGRRYRITSDAAVSN